MKQAASRRALLRLWVKLARPGRYCWVPVVSRARDRGDQTLLLSHKVRISIDVHIRRKYRCCPQYVQPDRKKDAVVCGSLSTRWYCLVWDARVMPMSDWSKVPSSERRFWSKMRGGGSPSLHDQPQASWHSVQQSSAFVSRWPSSSLLLQKDSLARTTLLYFPLQFSACLVDQQLHPVDTFHNRCCREARRELSKGKGSCWRIFGASAV